MAKSLSPGLYIVATPIGNLRDISLRALDTLAAVDLIICEDTRVTAKLLQHYGINKPLKPYNDHNGAAVRPAILKELAHKSVALVSDAGTPLISDPGYQLVREAVEKHISITSLPGASSVMTALTLAALPSDRFLFAGFVPVKKGARVEMLTQLKAIPATLIFFERASRLSETLEDMQEILGSRPAVIARELTKLYEETLRGTLGELAKRLAAAPVKGETVILVGASQAEASEAEIETALKKALETMRVKDAAEMVAGAYHLSKKDIYAKALTLKK